MKKTYTLIGVIHDPGDEDYCLRLNETGYMFNILITDRKHIISLNINLKTCDIRTARKRRNNIYKALYGERIYPMKKIKLTPEQKDILKCGEDAGGNEGLDRKQKDVGIHDWCIQSHPRRSATGRLLRHRSGHGAGSTQRWRAYPSAGMGTGLRCGTYC